MRLLHRKKASSIPRLPPEVEELVERMVMKEHIDREEAVRRILVMGVRYYYLKKTYGEHVDSRELWDRRYYYANVEAGYLYYRMRLGEVIRDFKDVIRTMSSILGELEACYKASGPILGEKGLERRIREYREIVVKYFKEYLFNAERELEEERYVSDKDVIKSLQEILKKYVSTGKSGKPNDSPPPS